MADRVYYHNEDATQSTDTTGVLVDKVSLTFTPNASKDHLIIWSALLGQSSTSGAVLAQLTDVTGGTTPCSTNYDALKDTTDRQAAAGLSKFTSGGSPGSQNFKIQFKRNNATGIANIQNAALVALEMTSNDKFAETTGDTTNATTTLSDMTTLTFTPGTTGDYLIIAIAEMAMSSVTTTVGHRFALLVDGATIDDQQSNVPATTDWETVTSVSKQNLTNASHTIKIQFARFGTSGTAHIRNARIAAIRLDDMPASNYAEDRSRTTTTSGSMQDKATLTFTAVATDYLCLWQNVVDGNSTSLSAQARGIDEGGATTGDWTRESSNTTAGNEERSYFAVQVRTLSAASVTFKTQYDSEGVSATAGSQYSAMVALQLKTPSANKTLDATTAGSYAITGTAATLEFGRKVVAASGSYAITGSAVTLIRGRPLAAAAGSYAVTGSAAALKLGRLVTAGAGSYAISGQATSLKLGRLVSAGGGSYAVSGQDVTLTKTSAGAKVLAADAGSYLIGGAAAALLEARVVGGVAGAYVISGMDAVLTITAAAAEPRPVILGGDDAPPKRKRRHVREEIEQTIRRILHPAAPALEIEAHGEPVRALTAAQREQVVTALLALPQEQLYSYGLEDAVKAALELVRQLEQDEDEALLMILSLVL